MEAIRTFFNDYVVWLSIPQITIIDILEMIIITFAVYEVIVWVKDTRAWMLVKGIVVLAVICLIAVILEMNVLLFVFKNTIGVGITALVIIFQPELRNALEQLGRKGFVNTFTPFDDPRSKAERISERIVSSIVRAVTEMAKVKTGALIIVEQNEKLREIERTGIILDSEISSQLLLNIFEHNTPLHDGAVILRNERIVAATCYLPLSDNMELNKELGTRHRAALGISEISDAFTIIVSEETGHISITYKGKLERNMEPEELTKRLTALSKKKLDGEKTKWWKGWKKNEADDNA